MPNEILGDNVKFQISTDSGTTFKDIICRSGGELNLSADVKERITQCGVIQIPSPVKGTISGSGVADSAPSATQVSHQDIAGILVNKTKVLARITDNPTTPASSEIYARGEGYFSSLRIGAPVDDAVDFDFEFVFSGTPDVTP